MEDFKTYTGTKRLKAWPMTRLKYNQYRGWELPSNENGEDEGYLVEYLDGGKSNHSQHEGYISWSPKDVFEKAYKEENPSTFLERLILEEAALGEKMTGLGKALSSDRFSEQVGDYQFELLWIQHSAMAAYRRVLNMRIKDLTKQK